MGWRGRVKWGLLGCLIGVLALVGVSALLPGGVTRGVELVASGDFATRVRALGRGQDTVSEDTLIEMVVETVGVSSSDNQPVVLLKEKAGERYLPIWIGSAEADAIMVAIEGIALSRPLSPDLTISIMDRLAASVNSIIINDIRNHTFYASIFLTANWVELEIDSRPSDAIAIAVRVGAPIYAEETVLEKEGIGPKQEPDGRVVNYLQALPVNLYY